MPRAAGLWPDGDVLHRHPELASRLGARPLRRACAVRVDQARAVARGRCVPFSALLLACAYCRTLPAGYSPADQPLPRGEVHIGGPALANGYHNAEEATDADFYTDGDGMRWFRTGDIGVAHPDGCLSIVDRRKDIVKLERGEFLSLGKVEAALQAEGTLVAHACVVAKGTMKAPAVLVAPRMHALRERLGVPSGGDDDSVLRSPAATELVLKDLREAGRRAGLERWEVPAAVRLVAGPWTPESGLVTAALKVRRQSVQAAFKEDVDALLSP